MYATVDEDRIATVADQNKKINGILTDIFFMIHPVDISSILYDIVGYALTIL